MFVGMGANGASGGYNLENSLRFRSSASAYLNRTPATAGNRKIFTISLWMKGDLVSSPALFQARAASPTGQPHFVLMGSNGSLYILDQNAGTQAQIITTAVLRDPSAWYHVVVAIDTTEATAADRAKFYVNGDKLESFSTLDTFPLNYDTAVNNTVRHLVGARMPNSSTALVSYLDNYLTEVNFVDGQALTPSDFGETNSTTGVWQPKKYTGTYGTNGFYLKGRGTDNSGNGNNFTETNFNTTNSALATYDIMTDVPTLTDEDTANYATLNPLDAGTLNITVSNANLKFAVSANSWTAIRATIGISSGKWYWEITPLTGPDGNYFLNGIKDVTESIPAGTSQYVGVTSGSYGYYGATGNRYNNGSNSVYGSSFGVGDVVGVALDMDAGTLTFYKNNVSQGVAYSGLTGTFAPAFSLKGNTQTNTEAVNFGQRPFAYTPPTGYKKLNTFNLPDSSIVDGSENFNTVTYTGNGTSGRAITGVGFSPDLVWQKSRSNTYSNKLHDIIRGASTYLQSNTTTADVTQAQTIDSFDSDGFTVGNNVSYNGSGVTFVAWNWKAGGTAVSNTAGTITSQVSANPTAGFSVVTYTGTGGTKTVGHGLGVAPQMVIVKGRNGGTNWVVYHVGMGATKYMLMNTTGAAVTDSTPWNNTSPTSTVVSLGTSSNTNGNTAPFVAYCFADVEGYSKFGSYTGNGSADGPFVYTGFRPAYVLIKRTNAGASWFLWDSARNSYNLLDATLYPNLNIAEYINSTRALDLVSNGFKLRGTDSQMNASGGAYIYMAFAENPFKNSLAR
ncbi:SPRY domain containing protein [Methylophilales phage MEP301]|nr:SPRY domain containing protein [Methylophilales phage MEP301]